MLNLQVVTYHYQLSVVLGHIFLHLIQQQHDMLSTLLVVL